MSRTLYRYISLSSDERKYWFNQILLENRFYFSTAEELNDPYECAPIAKLDEDIKVVRADQESMARDVLKRQGIKVSRDELRKMVTSAMLRLKDPRYCNESIEEAIRKSTGILSLSKVPDSVTQWAYYADNHRGLCLGITFPENNPWFLADMLYTEDRPIIELVKFRNDGEYRTTCLVRAVTSKALEWEREEEVRVLQTKGGVHYSFPAEYITEVILGANISDNDRNFVLGTINNSRCTPLIRKCERSLDSFKLNMIDYV